MDTIATSQIAAADGYGQSGLKSLILIIYRRRWLLASITGAAIVCAAVVASFTPPTYRATTVLVHADSADNSSLISSALGQLGGIAALAGLEGNRDGVVVEAIALLKSREFTEDFIRDHNLLPRLFHRRWNTSTGRWKSGIRQPNLWDGYKLFDRKVRHVDEDKRTGVVTLEIDWEDPVEGAEWANDLVRRLNGQMKGRALNESRTTLEYLTKELRDTNVESVELAIQNLIEANMKEEALAYVRNDYVFRVVDPAAPADRRERLRPRWGVYLVTGAFFGLIVGGLAILAFEALLKVRTWIRSADAQ